MDSMLELSTKTKIVILIIVVATSFAFGRYSVNVKPDVAIKEITSKEDDKKENKDTHTQTIITETKKPDGTDVKVTSINQVADEIISQQVDTQTQTEKTLTQPKTSKINISILGANDFSKGVIAPIYGVSVSKEIFGPVTVGAFGLMNGTVGISIGLDF